MSKQPDLSTLPKRKQVYRDNPELADAETLGHLGGSVMDMGKFGDLMRERRESKGWSQRQLAEMLHVVDLWLDPSAITRIERGTRDVKLTEAIAISNLLEFQLGEFSMIGTRGLSEMELSQKILLAEEQKALVDQLAEAIEKADISTPDRVDPKKSYQFVAQSLVAEGWRRDA